MMKPWLDALEWPGKVMGALVAVWALAMLIPKGFRNLRALYRAIMKGVEIPDRLDAMESKLEGWFARIDRGQSHMIQTRRVLLDRETANAFFECDAAGNCQWVSRYWRRMTGLDIDEAMGSGWEMGIGQGDRARVISAWRDSLEKRRPFEETLTYVDRTGITTRMHVFVQPIQDDQTKEIIGWFGHATKA